MDNQWKNVNNIYIKDSTWKQQNNIYIKSNNVWQNIYSGVEEDVLAVGTLWDLSGATPQQIGTYDDWIYASSGKYGHNLAIRQEGQTGAYGSLWAWGNNSRGQLGLGDTTTRSTPTKITGMGSRDTNWSICQQGWEYSMGINNGELFTWGKGYDGQLGHGDYADKYQPTLIGNCTHWRQIQQSLNYSLAILDEDYGDNYYGSNHMCIFHWGANELEMGTTNVPQQMGNLKWKSVVAYQDNQLGILNDGTLWKWGESNMTPTQISSESWKQIVATGVYWGPGILCIKDDNSLYGMGFNYGGIIDPNGDEDLYTLTLIDNSDWKQCSVYNIGPYNDLWNCLLLKKDGTLWKLLPEQNNPVQIGTSTWKQIYDNFGIR